MDINAGKIRPLKELWPVGILSTVVIFLTALLIGYLFGTRGVTFSALTIVTLIALAVVVLTYSNVFFGLILLCCLIYFSPFLERVLGFEDFPFGTLSDIFVGYLFFVVLIRIRKENDAAFWKSMKHPIFIMYFINLGFTLVQILNPSIHFLQGYLIGVARFSSLLLFIIVSLYCFKTEKNIYSFFRFILIVAVLSGLYGCYQQWVGLPSFDKSWVMQDPGRYATLVLFGNFRMFSFIGDPTIFGIFMVIIALFCVAIVASGITSSGKSVLLVLAVIVMLLAMTYSGTRTAYAIFPVGIFLFFLLRINKINTLVYTLIIGLVMGFVLFGPIYGNYSINRLRSTIRFSDDASMSVRNVTRKKMQPYIWSHPIGGGLNTTGRTGRQYNPGHFLSHFPPDSGYLKTALETGWIGLILSLTTYFFMVSNAVLNYFKAKNNRIKACYLALALVFYCVAIANYTQIVVGNFPFSIVFYPFIAINIKLIEFDNETLKPFNSYV